MSSLTPEQVALQLSELPDWHVQEGRLVKTFEFTDFASAIAFMTHVAFYCEQLEHHPHWENYYNILTVHIGEVGQCDVHSRDVQLAKRMQACFTES